MIPFDVLLPDSHRVYQELTQPDNAPIFVAYCCDRLYMSRVPAARCKDTKEIPLNIEVKTEGELEAAVRKVVPYAVQADPA